MTILHISVSSLEEGTPRISSENLAFSAGLGSHQGESLPIVNVPSLCKITGYTTKKALKGTVLILGTIRAHATIARQKQTNGSKQRNDKVDTKGYE